MEGEVNVLGDPGDANIPSLGLHCGTKTEMSIFLVTTSSFVGEGKAQQGKRNNIKLPRNDKNMQGNQGTSVSNSHLLLYSKPRAVCRGFESLMRISCIPYCKLTSVSHLVTPTLY